MRWHSYWQKVFPYIYLCILYSNPVRSSGWLYYPHFIERVSWLFHGFETKLLLLRQAHLQFPVVLAPSQCLASSAEALSWSRLCLHLLLSIPAAFYFPQVFLKSLSSAFNFTHSSTHLPWDQEHSARPLLQALGAAGRESPWGLPPPAGDSPPGDTSDFHASECLHTKVKFSLCEVHFLHTWNVFSGKNCIEMLLFWLTIWFVCAWP